MKELHQNNVRGIADDITSLLIGAVLNLVYMFMGLFESQIVTGIATTVIMSTVSFFTWKFWKWITGEHKKDKDDED